MGEFNWDVRVYYEDTDAAGLVYHANYLKYMERARTEYLRALGHSHSQLREHHGVMFVVHHVSIDFKRPARIDDELRVCVTIDRRAGASLRFYQRINKGGESLCEANVNIVCLDADLALPKRIPASLLLGPGNGA